MTREKGRRTQGKSQSITDQKGSELRKGLIQSSNHDHSHILLRRVICCCDSHMVGAIVAAQDRPAPCRCVFPVVHGVQPAATYRVFQSHGCACVSFPGSTANALARTANSVERTACIICARGHTRPRKGHQTQQKHGVSRVKRRDLDHARYAALFVCALLVILMPR